MRQPILEKLAGLLGKPNREGKARIFANHHIGALSGGAAGAVLGSTVRAAAIARHNKKIRKLNEGLAENDPQRKKTKSVGKEALLGAAYGTILGSTRGLNYDMSANSARRRQKKGVEATRSWRQANRDAGR